MLDEGCKGFQKTTAFQIWLTDYYSPPATGPDRQHAQGSPHYADIRLRVIATAEALVNRRLGRPEAFAVAALHGTLVGGKAIDAGLFRRKRKEIH